MIILIYIFILNTFNQKLFKLKFSKFSAKISNLVLCDYISIFCANIFNFQYFTHFT